MDKLNILNSEVINLLIEHDMLNQLVGKLIVNNIADNIELTDEEINSFKTNFFRDEKIENESQYQTWLIKKSLTSENYYLY